MLLEAGSPPFGMFRNLKEIFYIYIFVFLILLFKGTEFRSIIIMAKWYK
jgi:hypothetical protein